ncbi:oligosaccharide flippase family protein [Lonepinella sp. BR2357]|uniref:oligosaccharide flippase family protein n=1 Tax=Lonepinella sp. BR2357 TaxID=3434549 RepID=UPI003F6E2E3C
MINNLFKHTLVKNLIALALVQVANYLVPLLAWPLLAKGLGLEQFGSLMVLFSICTLAYILTDFGFNLSATHNVVQYREDRNYIKQYIANVFTLKLVFAVFASVVAVIYIIFNLLTPTSALNTMSIVWIIAIIFAQSLHCIWFFQGIEKMKYITIANMVAKVGYVAMLALLFLFYKSINLALFCFFISQLIVSIIYLVCIYKENYQIGIPNLKGMWQELKYSFSFFLSRLAVSVYTAANVLILGSFQGSGVAGLYGSAEKLYGAGTNVSGIVSQVLFPYLTRTGNLKLLLKLVLTLIIPVVVGCYMVGIFADDLMVLIFGEDFRLASEYFKLFLVLLCISFFSVIIGYPGFSAVKKVHFANYTVMFGAVVHLTGLFMLYLNNAITAKNVLLMNICTESVVLLLRCGGVFYVSNKNMQVQ